MTGSPHLTIGNFSRLSRLSLKALRLYDEMGLLKPVSVNPDNGYRYYSAGQLESARLIGLLRRLEMPLAQIAEVITLEADAAAKSIGEYWQGVEADVKTKRQLVRYLTAHLSKKGQSMFKIETRPVPTQQLLTIERHVLVDRLPGFIEEGLRSLHQHLGAKAVGVPIVIYHGEVGKDSDGPVEVCVPYEGVVEPADGMRTRTEESHEEAFTRISKQQVAFPGILEAYEAVEKWIAAGSLSPAGSPREVYFADWDAISEDDPACDVAFPVRT